MTTALIGDKAVDFITSNRECLRPGEQPVMLTITAPLELSYEDMVAALFLNDGMAPDELTDAYVPVLVADAVYNEGLVALARARDDMDDAKPGTDKHEWLLDCHKAVTRVFGGPTAAPAVRRRRTCARRPELVGVGA
jgi:hypothetical protein